jgi:hypothetical protein
VSAGPLYRTTRGAVDCFFPRRGRDERQCPPTPLLEEDKERGRLLFSRGGRDERQCPSALLLEDNKWRGRLLFSRGGRDERPARPLARDRAARSSVKLTGNALRHIGPVALLRRGTSSS